MRGYARKFQHDEDQWGIAGLLHDFDWEICPTPEDHPNFVVETMKPIAEQIDLVPVAV